MVESNRVETVKLVPGGRFFVASRSSGTLECWNIERQSLFATYRPQREISRSATMSIAMPNFQFEVGVTDDEQNIVILTKSYSKSKKNKDQYVQMQEIR